MYKVEILPSERFEVNAIARRRREEAERKTRFFNPHERILGIDTAALQQQSAQKQFLKAVDAEVDSAYAGAADKQRELLSVLEAEQERQRAQEARDTDAFRREHQRASSRREWYLNDPHVVRKDLPPRLTPNDPRTTVSGLQKFAGEDLARADRVRLQHEQVRVWNAQAAQSRRENEAAAAEQRQREDAALDATSRALAALGERNDELRRERTRQIAAENQRLAQDRRTRETAQRKQDTREKMDDIQGQISGSLLTESASAVGRQAAGSQLLHDRFKGMTDAQREEILAVRAQQLCDKEQQQKRELAQNSTWARQMAASSLATTLLEREAERRRRQLNRAICDTNLVKAQRDREYQSYLDKELYVNQPTQDYFAQFNTSSR